MSERIKVLQVGKYYPPVRGGIETHLEVLCQGLKDHVDLHVVVANQGQRSKKAEIDGVSVYRAGTLMTVAGAPITLGLVRIMREVQADIIHIHTPHPFALAAFLFSRTQSQLVCTYHSDIVRQRFLAKLIGPFQHKALQYACAILVGSQELINTSSVLRQHRERCVVVPFGIDVRKYEQLIHTTEIIKQRFRRPILLGVGRLIYYKGFDILIEAIARLTQKVTLLIIGDGPLRPKLQDQIKSLGLADSVFLLGNVPDATPYYQACEIFVLPSVARSEAFGIVQLEAMASGKPVINTALESGVPFVSRDGETGFTVPPGDASALAAALNRLITDRDLAAKFGEAGRRRLVADFSAERMVQKTLAIYHDVL